ncbi:CWC16 protein [Xylaria sp. FL0043]|nr:CWC16 protein [Xylaria sp. FL0043]
MQGFNMGRYVPPDVEGTISGNALNKKHALGSRASKLRTEGILTVRFEMPFGVWCGTCPKPTLIGQGVRFNAEKKKVGAYHTTPVWSFRMRHADCGGAIEIRTDPANAEYVVVEGGTRRDTGDDKDDSLVSSSALIGGLGEILTSKEKEALRNDAFARLERTIEDRGVLIERSHRIAELEDASNRAWEDPYAQNRRLRAAFRTGRKAREKEAASTEELRERMSLGIDLLPATEEDARRAALVDFGVGGLADTSERSESDGERIPNWTRTKDAALTKPLFALSSALNDTHHATISKQSNGRSNQKPEEQQKGKKRLKSEIKASQTRDSLASEITRNMRASHDPFLLSTTSESSGVVEGMTNSKTTSRIQGIKRKQPDDAHTQKATSAQAPSKHPREKETGEAETLNKEDFGKEIRMEPTISQARSSNSDGGGIKLLHPSPPKTQLVEYDSD